MLSPQICENISVHIYNTSAENPPKEYMKI